MIDYELDEILQSVTSLKNATENYPNIRLDIRYQIKAIHEIVEKYYMYKFEQSIEENKGNGM